MTLDPKTFRKGGKVTVRGVIVGVAGDGAIYIEFGVASSGRWLPPDRIATYEPPQREFKTGDVVTHANHGGMTFNVIASNDKGALWVEDAGGWSFVDSTVFFRHADESE